jgi:hypothetical protein
MIRVMRVRRSYALADGTPVVDVFDAYGGLYIGVRFATFGGGGVDRFLHFPPSGGPEATEGEIHGGPNAEVLCAFTDTPRPQVYVVGVLPNVRNSARTGRTGEVGTEDAAVSWGDARVVWGDDGTLRLDVGTAARVQVAHTERNPAGDLSQTHPVTERLLLGRAWQTYTRDELVAKINELGAQVSTLTAAVLLLTTQLRTPTAPPPPDATAWAALLVAVDALAPAYVHVPPAVPSDTQLSAAFQVSTKTDAD